MQITSHPTADGAKYFDQSDRNAMPVLLRMLNWLADRDSDLRQAHKLRNMPQERLEDMGMTRKQACA
ncbi:MAG: hypothetical protein ACJASV_002840 [Pseudorhodobacter sp.]|jgi:uncharacterized protein YjiS (DUF1127 family)